MGKMIKGWKCAICGVEYYTAEEANECCYAKLDRQKKQEEMR